jgi:hypothetical protein
MKGGTPATAGWWRLRCALTIVDQTRGLTREQRTTFVAAFLGRTMDAFDYFLVVLVYAEIGKEFGVSLTEMAFLTTVTLVMRPVGAFLFGRWADTAGRRLPLMGDSASWRNPGSAAGSHRPEGGSGGMPGRDSLPALVDQRASARSRTRHRRLPSTKSSSPLITVS